VGLIVGSVVCVGLHFYGLTGRFYGVPYIILYGTAVGIGATLLSSSLRIAPNKE